MEVLDIDEQNKYWRYFWQAVQRNDGHQQFKIFKFREQEDII